MRSFFGWLRESGRIDLNPALLLPAPAPAQLLPKALDEEGARLHIEQLGVKLTRLSESQAEYIDVPLDGPYKPDHYRY